MVHTRTVEMAEFSPDGTMVVTCSQDHTARVWNSGTGEPGSPPMRHSDQLWAAAFSPDGQRVATGGADGVVRVWDATTGLAVSEPLRHTGGVVRLRFSPDGNQLAAATIAPANAVCVWHVTTVRGASPAWLADLAEVVAGVRFGPANTLSNLTSEKVLDVRDHVLAYRGETLVGFAGFARWFFADRATRPLSEGSPMNVTTYLQARLAENTVESLEEVLRFQPTNTHALSSLAELKWRQPGALSEAIALANRALQIDPDFQVARRLLAAMTGKDPTQAVPK
jgi:WD40 repeat protein